MNVCLRAISSALLVAACVLAPEAQLHAQGSDAAVLEDVLRAAEPDVNDDFGFSLDVWGDRAVLGAWHEDSSAPGVGGDQNDENCTSAGAAYYFSRRGTSWGQRAY